MRKSSLVCLIAGLFLLTGAGSVSATTVNLIWTAASDPSATGIGTNAVQVSGAGVTLTLDYVVGIDANGVSSFGLDIEFDTDGGNELNILGFSEITWANAKANRNLVPIAQGLTKSVESGSAGPEGQLFGFDLFTLGLGPNNLTLAFARMVFVTTANTATDGLDIFATNERDPTATALFDNNSANIAFALPSASVGLLPEPHGIAMLGLAIGTLAAAGWRRR